MPNYSSSMSVLIAYALADPGDRIIVTTETRVPRRRGKTEKCLTFVTNLELTGSTHISLAMLSTSVLTGIVEFWLSQTARPPEVPSEPSHAEDTLVVKPWPTEEWTPEVYRHT